MVTPEQKKVATFMEAIGQVSPKKPTLPTNSIRALRVKLLLEEVLELAAASGIRVHYKITKSEGVDLDIDGMLFRATKKPADLVQVADALADIKYVTEGAAVSYGMNLAPFFDAVHENNMTKVETGYRTPDGKWQKGKDFKPVDLSPILAKQMK